MKYWMTVGQCPFSFPGLSLYECVCCAYVPNTIFVCLRVHSDWPQTFSRSDPSPSISVTTVPILSFFFSVIFMDCDLCVECLSSFNTVIKAVLHFHTAVRFRRSLALRLAPVRRVKCTSSRRAFWTWVASWRFPSDQKERNTARRLRFLTRSYDHSQTPAELLLLAPFVSCTPLCH